MFLNTIVKLIRIWNVLKLVPEHLKPCTSKPQKYGNLSVNKEAWCYVIYSQALQYIKNLENRVFVYIEWIRSLRRKLKLAKRKYNWHKRKTEASEVNKKTDDSVIILRSVNVTLEYLFLVGVSVFYKVFELLVQDLQW